MITNYSDLKQLNSELESVMINTSEYHSKMDQMREFYTRSAFYPTKSGQPQTTDLRNNLLKVYADKNVHFTSKFPNIKVPTSGASPIERQAASIREKIILGVWDKCEGPLLQRKWAWDATVFSIAVSETGYDIKGRSAYVKRYDPRFVFWQRSNGNDRRVVAFWAVWPITKDEAQRRYGVTPRSQPIATTSITDQYLKSIDGKEWFLMAIRWDENVRVAWVGDQQIEEPHNHNLGFMPVDMAMPFDDADNKGEGAFYLDPMLPAQAELNYTIARRSKIVSRMSNPLVWGRGIVAKQLDDVKSALKGGGFVGMKSSGELGILQLQDVKLLNEHEESLRKDLQRLSGFSDAAMGELAGANTSGDALGMYFTPTQRHIENQNIAWRAFYQSINSKILRVTERFAKTDETLTVSGYSPSGTVLGMTDSEELRVSRGSFLVQYTKEVIGGNYNSIVEFNPVTPKNELEEKRLVADMVDRKFISRTTGYEMIGIESPEDELALLRQEQSEPILNSGGMKDLVAAMQSGMGPTPNPQLPTPPTSLAKELPPNVQSV